MKYLMKLTGWLFVLRALIVAWTAPRTWATNELVTATIMNTHVRDNLDALKAPPSDEYTLNEGSDYSGATGTFADIDGTNLALTITTGGGDVMVGFHGTFYTTTGTTSLYLDVDVDGARDAGDDGIMAQAVATTPSTMSFVRLITGLSASSHTFSLQWKGASTHRLSAGSGTAPDVHPQFWVREVS